MTDQCSENYGHKVAEGFIRSLPITGEEYSFLVAAKSGDPAAFDALCKQSANTIFNMARRMMRCPLLKEFSFMGPCSSARKLPYRSASVGGAPRSTVSDRCWSSG